jgi:hypothetical protein
MLRVGYLPSDFHPMVLLLGEAEDLRALAAVLRRCARERRAMPLEALAFCEMANGTRILLSCSDQAEGMRSVPGGGLAWRLAPGSAEGFAELVEQLAVRSRVAGSEMLECETEGEIPVKVSRGEYTDDFLTTAIGRPGSRLSPG